LTQTGIEEVSRLGPEVVFVIVVDSTVEVAMFVNGVLAFVEALVLVVGAAQ
jgi:hypothetical protein